MFFAAPEFAEFVSGRKGFKSAAKNVGGQTLKKQLGVGSKQERVNTTESAKQTFRSRRDVFTNRSR